MFIEMVTILLMMKYSTGNIFGVNEFYQVAMVILPNRLIRLPQLDAPSKVCDMWTCASEQKKEKYIFFKYIYKFFSCDRNRFTGNRSGFFCTLAITVAEHCFDYLSKSVFLYALP